MTDDTETRFASLLASRLCHDLVNPAGALSTGLDVLANENDPDMRAHADSLVKESTDRLLAVIEYARLAYGASGGGEGDIDTTQMQDVATRMFRHLKPELHWNLPGVGMPKREARAVLNILLCTERMSPRRGSSVTVEQGASGTVITARGPRASMPEDVAAAFAGDDSSEEPKIMPARLAGRLAASAGKTISYTTNEDEVIVSLS